MNTNIKTRPKKIVEKKTTPIEPPPLYRVLLLNDDYTPMDFVVLLLQKFFAINEEKAIKIMFKVHTEGKAVCGLYPRDIAQTKVEIVCQFARENKHPLVCTMEEDK